jgi:ABC-type dipeptide/oligopeptide/nickel transport system ATPase subunit
MTFEIAKREATPMLIGVAGTSGSGKTYSALLLAAAIAGKDGKVGFIDTEMGRGSMYADDAEIVSVMPQGQYLVSKMTEPFSPIKYTQSIKEAINSGITVLVIDSMSHEWEGSGGCCDIAENNKLGGMPNWAMAKMAHKRLINLCTQTPIHIIFCLRARDKTKPVKVFDSNGRSKTEMVNEGMTAIQEKNFMFEMTLSIMMNNEKAGEAKIIKCPKQLRHLFNQEGDAMITSETGKAIKDWSAGGVKIDLELRNIAREFRDVAMNGKEALMNLHGMISAANKLLLQRLWTPTFADEVKQLALEADNLNDQQKKEDEENLDVSQEDQNKLFKTDQQ